MGSNINEHKLHVVMKSKPQINKDKFITNLKHMKNLELNDIKLIRAVTTNNCEKVEELLASKISPNISDKLFRTPLHLAASRNYKDIITILLRYGADPNQRDIIGNTALHLAACSNNFEIVTLLLDAGTDITLLDKNGRNPLQLAESKLRILQDWYREGFIELPKLRTQLKQIIELMQSYLKRQEENLDSLKVINLKHLSINDSSDAQIDNQMSLLLDAIQNFTIK